MLVIWMECCRKKHDVSLLAARVVYRTRTGVLLLEVKRRYKYTAAEARNRALRSKASGIPWHLRDTCPRQRSFETNRPPRRVPLSLPE